METLLSDRRTIGPNLTPDRLISEVTRGVRAIEDMAEQMGVTLRWDSTEMTVGEGEYEQTRRIMDIYYFRELNIRVVGTPNKKEAE